MEQSTIEVLDDEPEMGKALRRLLTFRGYQVEEYERGVDVPDALGSHRPGCLLLDLRINGFEVIEAFLARQIHVPVIVIPARDEPGTAERVRGLAAVLSLKKLVDRDTLLSSISAALSHHETPSP